MARKARKFLMQGNRLAISGLELAYTFHGISHAPRSVIAEKMLPEIDVLLSELHKSNYKDEKAKETQYGNGKGGYWDDYCLAMFLKGVCLRYVAYPVSKLLIVFSEATSFIGSRRRNRYQRGCQD